MWWVLRHRVDIESQLQSQHQLKFMNKTARPLLKNMHLMLLRKKFVIDCLSSMNSSLFICYFHQGRTSSSTSAWTKSWGTPIATQRTREKCSWGKNRFVYLVCCFVFSYLINSISLTTTKKRMQLAVIRN